MRDWIRANTRTLRPFAQATRLMVSEVTDSMASGSTGGHEQTSVAQNTTQASDTQVLKQPYPHIYTMQAWSEFSALGEKDVSLETFNVELERMRPKLEELIQHWRSNVEETLVNLLLGNNDSQTEDNQASTAEDPQALGGNLPKFTLSLGTGSPVQSLGTLSTNMQQLLRADSVFNAESTVYFYPDDFSNLWFTGTYNTDYTRIAKAFLSTLGRPDATYLEMKAAGKVFLCGRCHSNERGRTWKEMIQHYIGEEFTWNSAQRCARVRTAANFTYQLSHDIKTVKQDKPLIKVATKEQAQPVPGYHHGPYYACQPCKSVGLSYIGKTGHILGHLEDAHLVSEPDLGVHYK
ncbi:hypothetical protein BDV93DRAFT_288581 [Ceratobasidium sp. AG-I]|nr:hypothetical protein BDV93DRAFT_288581 [Ceratobasidium sp. AG-I]